MMKVERRNTWREVKTFMDELRSKGEFIWRGHSDSGWVLSSSLYRYFESQSISDDYRGQFEKAAVAQFKNFMHQEEIQGSHNSFQTMDFMVKMQHYGCPTRLIDWTWSPYIAAYFVLPDMAEQGALYALNITDYQAFIGPKLPLDDYDQSLLSPLPNPIFNRFLADPNLQYPIPIAQSASSGRVAEQQCVFLFDLVLSMKTEEILANLPVEVLWKIEFPRDIRLDVHADLITMNIDGAHLFGNTEGAALRAKEWLFGAQHHGHSIKTVDVDY